ncbi:MAG: SRPBCC family protein [Culicoidibacterales bacterium]
MKQKFEMDHIFEAKPELVFEVIHDLTMKQMDSVGKATRKPKKIIGTTYEYQLLIKKRQMRAKFTITDFKRPLRFAYQVEVESSLNETIWEIEVDDDNRTYVHYTEQSGGSSFSSGILYKLAGFFMQRKQKQATTQLFAAIYEEIIKRQN